MKGLRPGTVVRLTAEGLRALRAARPMLHGLNLQGEGIVDTLWSDGKTVRVRWASYFADHDMGHLVKIIPGLDDLSTFGDTP